MADQCGSFSGGAGRNRAEVPAIPNYPGDMPEGTLRAILKQAAIDPEDFLKL